MVSIWTSLCPNLASLQVHTEAVGGVARWVDFVAIVTFTGVVAEVVDAVGAGGVTLGVTGGALVDVWGITVGFSHINLTTEGHSR